ncbi:MAG: deoxyribodipyrimidine photolyase [Deltaproteobacteria bacterium]|nr:deoxyribodipyrimidine photolyase [Deltaproteobacteria bacterium]
MRVSCVVDRPIRAGDHVLYWMIGARRTRFSHALDHAIARAVELGVPLIVLEPLRCGYDWASDRMHAFVLQGMADNARAFAAAGVTYLPYVEPEEGAGKGLLAALAAKARVVVTDEQPGFFLPRMVAAAGRKLDVRLEQVDGNGILPLRAADGAFATAMAFRRHFQRVAGPHLASFPAAAPLARVPKVVRDAALPRGVARRWPAASAALLAASAAALAKLPIDHGVAPVTARGGAAAAAEVLDTFVDERLARYLERSHPDADVASGLSPYLHFGHAGAHEVVRRVLDAAGWDPSRLGPRATGKRAGWWGAPPEVEAFLDELITWRELGYGFCFHRADHASYGALPAWARATLDEHAADPRPVAYTRAQLAGAATYDRVWNAAQRELLAEGRIHNYLRMVWGKKILEWSRTPRAALATMIELNNRYAVDGRDPNSYSGILWTLGLFDRPWGPVRPIFGTVRYMSSEATVRKLDVARYLARWGEPATQQPSPSRY